MYEIKVEIRIILPPVQFYYAFKKLFSINYDKVNITENTASDTDSILLQYKNYEKKQVI